MLEEGAWEMFSQGLTSACMGVAYQGYGQPSLVVGTIGWVYHQLLSGFCLAFSFSMVCRDLVLPYCSYS